MVTVEAISMITNRRWPATYNGDLTNHRPRQYLHIPARTRARVRNLADALPTRPPDVDKPLTGDNLSAVKETQKETI